MPSYIKSLTGEERWLLANFIKSMQREPTSHRVLKVKRIKGELPLEPDSTEWEEVEPMDVRMTGQVIAAPRWQNPSVEMMRVRAIYNKKEIAFLYPTRGYRPLLSAGFYYRRCHRPHW